MPEDHRTSSKRSAVVDAVLVAAMLGLALLLLRWAGPLELLFSPDPRQRLGVGALLSFAVLLTGVAVYAFRRLARVAAHGRQLELELAARGSEDLERTRHVLRLEQALGEARTQQGLLAMCSWCKSIRDGGGDWSRLEDYLERYLHAAFTHGVCPECMRVEYPGLFEKQ